MLRDKWVRKEIAEMKRNLSFLEKNEIRVITTSNMSAGKSTLLNCLIGDNILPSSQERCTSNLTFIYQKMSDNHRISVYDEKLRVDLPDKSVTDIDWKRPVSIYSELKTPYSRKLRLCLIDTPGVNSSTETAHGKITKNAIKTEHYDKLLYIVSRPGTDEEIEYLKWIVYNADRDKVIFVLNKIDEYRNNEDNVKESIARLNTDLKNIGFNNPTICPTSSYFGLLLKKSKRFQALDDNEKDDLKYLIKKFSRDDNDMSIYYPKGLRYYGRDSIKIMESKCGVYELERMVLGGQKSMKKIFIKYNPYMLKTEITVDNKPLADNSVLADRISDGTRLQEWIEDLPDILVDEYNDTDFDVTFHGTLLDYEDVSDVFKRAFDEGKITAKLERIPAKETKDKEKLIDEVFEEIQKGPLMNFALMILLTHSIMQRMMILKYAL